MRTRFLLVVTMVFVAALGGGSAERAMVGPIEQSTPGAAQPGKRLRAFASEQELEAFLKKLAQEQPVRRLGGIAGGVPMPATAMAAENAAAAPAAGAAPSITNVQHAGVDEGGIVKLHGDHLVVLRRGRLFTVAIGGSSLAPVSTVDAYAPDIDPAGTWYDEMLVAGDAVIVIGYSYRRGGTEIGLFDIDRLGRLRYRATYHLRSNDYYSSRNYSSRLLGSKLVFYTPLFLGYRSDDLFRSLPALRRWEGDGRGEFRRIASASRIYRPVDPEPGSVTTLHTVTVCDLARREFTCEATVVMGPAGRVFYVSPQSVYVWTSDWRRRGDRAASESTLYQMPLDGSVPGALKVAGSPVDQFSFLEGTDGHLNVLVRSEAGGDGMWRPEVAAGDVALMRIRTDAFSDGRDRVPEWQYRPLPKPEGYTFQNRFVGQYLLYGTGSGWGRPVDPERTRVYAVRYAGSALFDLTLPHTVDRIEAMGGDAVIVGTSGRDLHFTALRLGNEAAVRGSFTRPGASQSELRSHGFFYRPESADSGMLGLPITRPGRPGYRHLTETSAAILFLRNAGLRFTELGELAADGERLRDDSCRASCVDWYGNARPLFIGTRIFALMGYEIVEGELVDGRMQERRRISYAPRGRTSN